MEATLIHLSDLHFKNDVENRFRIKLLREDLARLSNTDPVVTVFTGDLIHAGDENIYDLLFEELIGPLLELGHEIAVVPGNHDIQRSVASSDFTEKCLADRGSGYLFDGTGNIKDPHPNSSNDPLSNYRSFEELFGPFDERTYWGYVRDFGSISVIGLNSTWLSRTRDSNDSDRGKLRIEPHVLDKLTENLPETSLKIALLHHPLDWLEENTRDAVSKLITSRVDIALFGHVHSGDLSNLAYGDSNCLFVQSPPLRAGWSKGTNGYSIIRCNVENKRFQVDYRSYSATRREFVRGEDFADNGSCFPRPEDRRFFTTSPSETTLIQKFIDGAPYDFTDWHRNNIRSKTKRLGTFIMPKARKVPHSIEDRWLEPAESIAEIVVSSVRDQFFVAPLDAGSTTAAFLAFKQLSESFSTHKKVPAYFDANDQKINKASILRAISRSALISISHDQISRLVEIGSFVLVVDGLSLADSEQFNLFRRTANKFFPKVRFIYFLSTERKLFGPPNDGALNPDYSPLSIHGCGMRVIDRSLRAQARSIRSRLRVL